MPHWPRLAEKLKKRARIVASLPTDAEARRKTARYGKQQLNKLRKSGKHLLNELRRSTTQTHVAAPADGPRIRIPAPPLPDGPINRPDLTVAIILDPFSELAFRYEWNQLKITPDNWRAELGRTRPDLLFVESAWNGNDKAWRLSMTRQSGPSAALRELVAWCREEGIPTVFWNKEDPPNYDRFIDTAALFDTVFTVDAGRIPDYVRDLDHDRVGLLPFAAQPRIHNPIRHDHAGAERPHDVAFAGTYFAEKHAERREQMDFLLEPARANHDLHIYSRMQNDDERYRFPARFQRNIVGSLPYEQMLGAYTAYKVFLNVNSVTTSTTMCARRIFELSAAQTAVLSAPAPSIPAFFGDDISVAANPDEAVVKLHNLLSHKELRDRQALRAHRRVFDEHLYSHRVDEVLRTLGMATSPTDQSISAVVPTKRPEQLASVWEFMERQVHPDVELVLVTHGFAPDPDLVAGLQERHPLNSFTIVEAGAELSLGALMNLGVEAASGRYVAKMDDDNYYAPHYLSDLVRAFSWTDAQVVGKWAHYVHIGGDDGPTLLRFQDHEHRYVRLVQGGTILTPREVVRELPFEDLPRRVDTTFLEKIRAAGGSVYSSDRFNFVSTRTADASGHTWGISTDEILTRSSRLPFFGPAEHHVTV